ncbi:FtsK/SpoIIIE domain-containing protein [Microbacterium telephonicum]|uniref:S-DNA-T family DNA segregation ATPase FtsK/SpoIIIE n=1 Tax=Microbacterium telephonicum TaxID=1714841 RepID=A0A498CGM1_9MICO|nr:FtsK/SpoIIIE domain-containing protein [Microbacterium telephonicum]RLK52380.1 S-DNA-T family DNA segregation ATPase FtsK/SpoIIIE [Microbacterium telephonicum]
MKLRTTLVRTAGEAEDVVITADADATVGDLARTLVEVDPRGAGRVDGEVTLEAFGTIAEGPGEVLDAAAGVAHVQLAAGSAVRVVPAGYQSRRSVGELHIVSGPGAGETVALDRSVLTIGRDPSCDIVLDDPLVSKRHARLEIGQGRAELIDLNSANGILVDGAPVTYLTAADGQIDAVLGETRVRIVASAPDAAAPATWRQIPFVRSPRVEARYLGEELPGTDLPAPPAPQMFPWLAMIAPVVMGLALFFIMKSPMALVFVAASPLLMLGTWLTTRLQSKAQLDRDKQRFEQQITRLGARLERERELERTVRRAEVPELDPICADALAAGPLVWTRRPEHWSFLHLRLGDGVADSRNTVAESSKRDAAIPSYVDRLDETVEAFRTVEDVPILESLAEAGALGIAGDPARVGDLARALVAQTAGLHAPSDVHVAAFVGPASRPALADLKWLPHTWAGEDLLGTAAVAENAATGSRLLARIEELVDQRTKQLRRLRAVKATDAATAAGAEVGESRGRAEETPLPAVVVLIAPDAAVDLGRLVQLSERAAGSGILPIWLATEPTALPASCRTWVEVPAGGQASAHFVRLGTVVAPLRVEALDAARFGVFCRALARLTDVGDVAVDAGDVPRTIPLVQLLGSEMATSADAVIDRWTQNASIRSTRSAAGYQPKLRALVGQGAQGALHLDLRQQGPHALVGGTTGSGKSEFLQAWVLGMAAEYSPERVTFLFVDYKGGSAFADCVNLPHCVGLVTDLSPHLVRRALTSLRAELHHREHLFNRKKAKDLLELEKAADPETPPALVLVIDEFAALAKEVPEFVDGVVDIAQRGRSLGIHLIMATQRPAGVIKDNLRANTNLRVALRMADETDSDDVIGSKEAALFDPGLPGRGIAKTGPGRMSLFQSAYAGGWSLRAEPEAAVEVRPFRLGDAPAWEKPQSDAAPTDTEDLGPNDQQLLVARFGDAAQLARIAPPRRPWLDELATTFDQTKLSQRSDARLVLGVVDLPERQDQVPFFFEPDTEGHLAIFGTGGSGKSATLRTLAVSAGITPRGGPVHVYGLDAATGGLRMLEPLPHVGAVISGDDTERIERLFGTLRTELDRRGDLYAAAGASTLTEYRSLAGAGAEPRILLLVDGFPAFRAAFEGVPGRAETYRAFQQVLTDGRGLGIHVALTADRGQSVPTSLQAMIQRRIVLRMADDDGYALLGMPRDILSPASPPGRAIIDDHEAQIAVIGGTPSTKDQSLAVDRMAEAMLRRGTPAAPTVEALPTEYTVAQLPATTARGVVIGLSDLDLGPYGIEPSGTFIVAGSPGAGRSNAAAAIAMQTVRAQPGTPAFYLGDRRSPVQGALAWTQTSEGGSAAMGVFAAAEAAADAVATGGPVPLVVLEGIGEFATSIVEMNLSALVKRAGRGEVFLVVVGELSEWTSNFGLLGEIKAARRGVILQPETIDGEVVLKTPFPRLVRGELPVGRGILAHRGKTVRIQFPLVTALETAEVS